MKIKSQFEGEYIKADIEINEDKVNIMLNIRPYYMDIKGLNEVVEQIQNELNQMDNVETVIFLKKKAERNEVIKLIELLEEMEEKVSKTKETDLIITPWGKNKIKRTLSNGILEIDTGSKIALLIPKKIAETEMLEDTIKEFERFDEYYCTDDDKNSFLFFDLEFSSMWGELGWYSLDKKELTDWIEENLKYEYPKFYNENLDYIKIKLKMGNI